MLENYFHSLLGRLVIAKFYKILFSKRIVYFQFVGASMELSVLLRSFSPGTANWSPPSHGPQLLFVFVWRLEADLDCSGDLFLLTLISSIYFNPIWGIQWRPILINYSLFQILWRRRCSSSCYTSKFRFWDQYRLDWWQFS